MINVDQENKYHIQEMKKNDNNHVLKKRKQTNKKQPSSKYAIEYLAKYEDQIPAILPYPLNGSEYKKKFKREGVHPMKKLHEEIDVLNRIFKNEPILNPRNAFSFFIRYKMMTKIKIKNQQQLRSKKTRMFAIQEEWKSLKEEYKNVFTQLEKKDHERYDRQIKYLKFFSNIINNQVCIYKKW